MKHGQNNRRQRSRGNNNRRYPNQRGNSFESNGPEVKVRGTAQQVLEKYQSLARDAFSSGDRVLAEGYLQFAEHYYRVMNSDAENQNRDNSRNNRQGRNNNRDGGQNHSQNADASNETDSNNADQSGEDGANKESQADNVKTVEITAPSGDQDVQAEVSATSEAPANDTTPKEDAPKKPRGRRPRKSEQAAETPDQSQAAD